MSLAPSRLPIFYEPHPVSPARKAELKKRGFRIVDIKFAPRPPAVVETAITAEGPPPPTRQRTRANTPAA